MLKHVHAALDSTATSRDGSSSSSTGEGGADEDENYEKLLVNLLNYM
jgi:hypothetical protein